jgi:hypothetical protein
VIRAKEKARRLPADAPFHFLPEREPVTEGTAPADNRGIAPTVPPPI